MIQTAADLSPTALRMFDTLPDYFWNNVLILRQLQAWADEVDRVDGLLDSMKNGFVPALADDTLGLLSVWERMLRLPVAPAGVSIAQRQQAVSTAWLRRLAVTAADVAALLGPKVLIYRNTPGLLEDTIHIDYPATSYQGGQILNTAQRLWPAHRALHYEFSTGFILDVDLLDRDAF